MNQASRPSAPRPGAEGRRPRAFIWIAAAAVLVLIIAVVLPRRSSPPPDPEAPAAVAAASRGGDPSSPGASGASRGVDPSRLLHSRSGASANRTPESIVAEKVSSLVAHRRGVAEELARRLQVSIPPEVDRFFAVAESGDWDEIKSLYNSLAAARESGQPSPELDALWPVVSEVYGAAHVSKSWPADELLNYGEAILSSMRPGMILIAGSDAARFIPMVVGETGFGDRPRVIPQNGLAEGNLIEYLSVLHGDRLSTITRQEAEQTFAAYMQDAQARVAQAQQNGGDVSVRPSELALFAEGKPYVAGDKAVAGLNERLLQLLLEKNPHIGFAMEQSVAMQQLYPDAVPLGPVLELRSPAAASGAVESQASQSVEYWRSAAQRLQSESSLPPDAPARNAYAQMAGAQAEYFADRQLNHLAEETYRLACEMAPASIDAIGNFARFLAQSGRPDEAHQAIDAFARQNPDYEFAANELRKTITQQAPAGTTP